MPTPAAPVEAGRWRRPAWAAGGMCAGWLGRLDKVSVQVCRQRGAHRCCPVSSCVGAAFPLVQQSDAFSRWVKPTSGRKQCTS